MPLLFASFAKHHFVVPRGSFLSGNWTHPNLLSVFYHPPSPAQSTLRNQQFVRHLSADPIEKAASTEINHAYTAMSVLSTSYLIVEETHREVFCVDNIQLHVSASSPLQGAPFWGSLLLPSFAKDVTGNLGCVILGSAQSKPSWGRLSSWTKRSSRHQPSWAATFPPPWEQPVPCCQTAQRLPSCPIKSSACGRRATDGAVKDLWCFWGPTGKKQIFRSG